MVCISITNIPASYELKSTPHRFPFNIPPPVDLCCLHSYNYLAMHLLHPVYPFDLAIDCCEWNSIDIQHPTLPFIVELHTFLFGSIAHDSRYDR